MTDFADCPSCLADPCEMHDCTTCEGTGHRPVSREAFEIAETAGDWAMEQVDDLFSLWCKATGRHPAYGVERYDLSGEKLHITQDTSARGCYDCASHTLPAAWLFATGSERKALIAAHTAEEKRARADRAAKARRDRLAHHQAEAASLAAEIEGGNT